MGQDRSIINDEFRDEDEIDTPENNVSKEEQAKRFKKREMDPLKHYKFSPVDKESQKLWDKYTVAMFSMLMASNTDEAPWTIIKSDDKKIARINCIKHILSQVDYPQKIKNKELLVDEDIVTTGSFYLKMMEDQNKFAKA